MIDIKVILKADTGNYLARCHSCIPHSVYPDSAFVHVKEAEVRNSPWAQFALKKLDNGKYTLKADSGNYLARCHKCATKAIYPDSAYVHVKEADVRNSPWAQWEIKRLNNGKYILKGDNGNYLARCHQCIPGGSYPDSAFVHGTEANAMNSAWAQWEIILMKDGTTWKQEEIPLKPAEPTTGQFQVSTNSATGFEFTNRQTKDISYKFTPSGTWKPKSDFPDCTAAGVKGFAPELQAPYLEALKPYQQYLKYQNNTYFALVAVNKTTGVVTEVGQETTIVLKPGETLTFVVNDLTVDYTDNTGTLTVKWSAT